MKANIILIVLLNCIFHFNSKSEAPIILNIHFTPDSLTEKILVINSFDARAMNTRKNKKELFVELTDSAKQLLYNNILAYGKKEARLIPELLKETFNKDSVVFQLMAKNNTSKAIVINKLDVYFNQTGVEVIKEENGKKRIASFDICATIRYSLYNKETLPKEETVSLCEFYTQRSVISGLLAAGPDVVGKRKDAFKIVTKLLDGHLAGAY